MDDTRYHYIHINGRHVLLLHPHQWTTRVTATSTSIEDTCHCYIHSIEWHVTPTSTSMEDMCYPYIHPNGRHVTATSTSMEDTCYPYIHTNGRHVTATSTPMDDTRYRYIHINGRHVLPLHPHQMEDTLPPPIHQWTIRERSSFSICVYNNNRDNENFSAPDVTLKL